MSARNSRFPNWVRTIPVLIALAAMIGWRAERAVADRLPPDPVDDLRAALRAENTKLTNLKTDNQSPLRDKQLLAAREKLLSQKASALQSPGQMTRALLLQEWRADENDGDRQIFNQIINRFIDAAKVEFDSSDPDRRAAIATLVAGTAVAARPFKTPVLRARLSKLAPEIAKLTKDSDAQVREAAARALGDIQPDPKLASETLGGLIKTADPSLRRIAAEALGNQIRVLAELEKINHSAATARLEREEFLKGATFAAPAATGGVAADQAVEVRRLSTDAWQIITSTLLEITAEPYQPDAAERKDLRPVLDEFSKLGTILSRVVGDPDPAVRIQSRRILEDLAALRLRLQRLDVVSPAGDLPAPKPAGTAGENKDEVKNDANSFYPPPPGTPTVRRAPMNTVNAQLVSRNRLDAVEQAAAGQTDTELLSDALRVSLQSIIAGLKDPNVRSRLSAIDVLDTMNPDAMTAIPALVERLRDKDRFVRWASLRTLGRVAPREGGLVVPAAARLLKDSDSSVKEAAAGALERYGPDASSAIPLLAEVVNTGDADFRIAAMRALDAIGTSAAPALPVIADNLVDTNARVRSAAAYTLGRFGPLAASTQPALRRAMNDIDPEVRRSASEAILKVAPK